MVQIGEDVQLKMIFKDISGDEFTQIVGGFVQLYDGSASEFHAEVE